MPREDIPEELVAVAAQAVERSLTFMGMEGTRLPGTEAVDVDATVGAVLSAVSEAGWVAAGEHNMLRAFVDRGEYADDVRAAVIAERDEARAQSDALAEALDGLLRPCVEYEEKEAARAALRAYRSSQESSDAT